MLSSASSPCRFSPSARSWCASHSWTQREQQLKIAINTFSFRTLYRNSFNTTPTQYDTWMFQSVYLCAYARSCNEVCCKMRSTASSVVPHARLRRCQYPTASLYSSPCSSRCRSCFAISLASRCGPGLLVCLPKPKPSIVLFGKVSKYSDLVGS